MQEISAPGVKPKIPPNGSMAVVQPSFLPWRGYFQLIGRSDRFLLYDDVQYDKRSWRNRNQIKTVQGLKWITVPVQTKGKFHQLIRDVRIDNSESWTKKILGSIRGSYARSAYFDKFYPWLEQTLHRRFEFLSDLDEVMIRDICGFLDIRTPIKRSSELLLEPLERVERLVELCRRENVAEYISGPSAADYIGASPFFANANIKLTYHNYSGLKTYTQLHGDFESAVSIIDTLMCCNADTSLLSLNSFQKSDQKGLL